MTDAPELSWNNDGIAVSEEQIAFTNARFEILGNLIRDRDKQNRGLQWSTETRDDGE